MVTLSASKWSLALVFAVLVTAQAPVTQDDVAPPATSVETASEAAGELSKDYDGNCIVFPGDTVPEIDPGEHVVRVDIVFSDEHIAQRLKLVRELYGAHDRLQNAFYLHSNLGTFATGGNPFAFQTAGGLAKLPDEAVIECKLTKQEYADLQLPAWDMLVLGGANAHNYLAAAHQYARYKIADLEIALMDCTGETDSDRRATLQSQRDEARQAVIEYFQTPPAD